MAVRSAKKLPSTSAALPRRVRVFEVGPRDGLQNESRAVPLRYKLELARELVAAGVPDFELGAFVRPDRVPQMADTDQLYELVRTRELDLRETRAWSLVPNARGMERAIAVGAKRVAVFTAATDSFTRKNIGMTVRESLNEFKTVFAMAKKARIEVRGYVSTAFGCPYEGAVKPVQPLRVIERLAELGAQQISIGDTIGVAVPRDVTRVVQPALRQLGGARVAVHFHDTRGTALANSLQALELGVTTIDSSIGGLGGCPYAPGASGNLATEDLVYMLERMGIRTGIDLRALVETSLRFFRRIDRPLVSRFAQAYAANPDFSRTLF